MANNQMIGTCEWCGQSYCQECSDHDEWQQYCSEKCAAEAKEDRETSHNTRKPKR